MTINRSRYVSKERVVGGDLPAVPIPTAVLDELVKGPMSPADVQALSLAFKKAVIERAMGAELSHYLGYRNGEAPLAALTNYRNGHSGKTVLADDGPVRIAVPRDRDAWKDRKPLAATLRPTYTAVSADAARDALTAFARGPWG